jgi:hypothetical protein
LTCDYYEYKYVSTSNCYDHKRFKKMANLLKGELTPWALLESLSQG